MASPYSHPQTLCAGVCGRLRPILSLLPLLVRRCLWTASPYSFPSPPCAQVVVDGRVFTASSKRKKSAREDAAHKACVWLGRLPPQTTAAGASALPLMAAPPAGGPPLGAASRPPPALPSSSAGGAPQKQQQWQPKPARSPAQQQAVEAEVHALLTAFKPGNVTTKMVAADETG